MYWVPALGVSLVNLIDAQAAMPQPAPSDTDVPVDAQTMARSA
jgi:hypothetical protein